MRWILGAAVVLLLAGCATVPAPAEKSGSGEVRHDLAPLTDRFPQLGEPESATWLSGTMGDAPGPSLYWIDAVIVLAPEEFDTLQEGSTLEQVPAPEAEVDLPAGPLLRSDELDAEFSQDEFQTEIYLDEASRSVVLITLFE